MAIDRGSPPIYCAGNHYLAIGILPMASLAAISLFAAKLIDSMK
jgi:hypothetical protein